QRTTVAGRAHPQLRLAGEHAAHPNRVDAGRDDLFDEDRVEVGAPFDQHGAVRALDVLGEGPRVHRGLHVLVHLELAVDPLTHRQGDRPVGAAVLLANDHVLRDVDQTTGEVTRVRGPQRGVGETLPRAVRGDEVLQYGETLAVAGLDRPRDDLTLRVGHQTTDRGDLPELEHVTPGARVDHLPQWVVLRKHVLHVPGDLIGRRGPDLDELAAAL